MAVAVRVVAAVLLLLCSLLESVMGGWGVELHFDTLNDAGKSLIERIATFPGILFGLSILNNSFPPSYLKGNTPVKTMLFLALAGYLLAPGAALWATQVRFYSRYTYNVTRSQTDLTKMIRHKVGWLRLANILFALGTILLAVLLLVIVWNV